MGHVLRDDNRCDGDHYFGVWLGDTAAAAQIAVVVIGGMFGVAGTSRGVKKEGGNGPPNNTVTK